MSSRQGATPNHHRSSDRAVVSLIWYRCTCNALWVLRSLSFSLQFLRIPHGSYCVLHATSFIPSSFHCTPPVRSLSLAMRQGIPVPRHKHHTRTAPASLQTTPQSSLGSIPLHSSSFHFSSVQSTRY